MLNCMCGLNLPPWPAKLSTLVARHIWPLATPQAREMFAHILFSSAFGPTPQFNICISCFLVFRSKSLEFTTCQYPWILSTSYFQTSSKDILFLISLLPFSCPPLPSSTVTHLCPRAVILLRLWRCISLTKLFSVCLCLAAVTEWPPTWKTSKSRKNLKVTREMCSCLFVLLCLMWWTLYRMRHDCSRNKYGYDW